MVNRTTHLIHLICSVAFLLGIVSTVVFWIGNSTDLITTISNNSVIIISYLFGGIAIVFQFINDKSIVKKQELSKINSEAEESANSSEELENNQSLVDYTIISKELEKAVSVEGASQNKSEKVLSVLCNGLKAGQGAMYKLIDDEGTSKLKVHASYAFIAGKNSEDGFEMNDGLLGLAVKEDRKIELNDIPKENVKVFSGLGQSAPSSIIIIPLKSKDEIKGVLELSFVGPQDKGIQKFVNDNMDKIGSLL